MTSERNGYLRKADLIREHGRIKDGRPRRSVSFDFCEIIPESPEYSGIISPLAAMMKKNSTTITQSTNGLDAGTEVKNHLSGQSRKSSVSFHESVHNASRRSSRIMGLVRRASNAIGFSNTFGGSMNNLSDTALEQRRKNRKKGDDALSTSLSALYAKFLVILGLAFPVTEILSPRIPIWIYQGFYIYLYLGSIIFVSFVYAMIIQKKTSFFGREFHKSALRAATKQRPHRFGSFYLRVGAICFGIGSTVYSGLEFGQYFETNTDPQCRQPLVATTALIRMFLCLVQMHFLFLNTAQMDLSAHRVISRFGLMHMVAANLCQWLFVLVEETKHEIFHLAHLHHQHHHHKPEETHHHSSALTRPNDTDLEIMLNSTEVPLHHLNSHSECQRTSIMGALVQNVSPFLFPCTIEFSLICAVIVFEHWKKIKSVPSIERFRRESQKHIAQQQRSAHHFSVDCSQAHRGLFSGIIVTVFTLICLIMYFVLADVPDYQRLATQEVSIFELCLFIVMLTAVCFAIFRMRDLKFVKKTNDLHASSVTLDLSLLVLAQVGVYLYGIFSIIGCFFAIEDGHLGGGVGLVTEMMSIVEASAQTLFCLNASWRKCRGAEQNRQKPGRELITFLLVCNMSCWLISTLIKGHASFRPSHLEHFGVWAWVIITHISMPLAIFFRFHSTICLFEIWKSAYKVKMSHGH